MTSISRAAFLGSRFDVVAGLSDGILTALILASGRLLNSSSQLHLPLALRVASASAISGAFVFFLAHYAVLRGQLVEAERQLNLMTPGQLAGSRLGTAALNEAVGRAITSSVCTFCGALLPLIVGSFLPSYGWIAVLIALIGLGTLGAFLGRSVRASPWLWACGALIGGLLLAYVGVRLNIV